MEPITRSIFGSYLQTCLLLGLPFAVQANSTLNEKFGVQPGIYPDTTTVPRMRYYAIGNGGHSFTVGANGQTKPDPVQHLATDAALYNHLPFVLRTIDNDLTPTQQALYGLRRQETHGGLQYFAYYLKRMDFTSVVPAMQNVAVADGTSTTTAFAPTSANLNPTPPDLSSGGVNLLTGDYASASAEVDLNFTSWDITEFLNVANVLYGDDGYAIVSEIALVSGVDKVVTSPAQTGTINFNEVIAAQVVSFVNTFFPAKYANNGNDMIFDIGSTEPLFKITQ